MMRVVIFVADALGGGFVGVFECIEDGEHASAVVDLWQRSQNQSCFIFGNLTPDR